jgi:oligogalacturonide lyase
MKKAYNLEERFLTDEATGRRIRQVTSHPSIHHHPFFLIPAEDDAMRFLFFVSHRTGQPQIFCEDRAEGCLWQLTDEEDLHEWSVHPARSGEYVYFAAGTELKRVHVDMGEIEVLRRFEGMKIRGEGMVAVGMGTTALSANGRWWSVSAKKEHSCVLMLLDTQRNHWHDVLEKDVISHMQFCPDDDRLLFAAGSLMDRVWTVDRETGIQRRSFKRDAESKQWITHESWIPGTRELAMVDWPHGILAVHADTGAVRRITGVNAWHAIADYAGKRMIADTNFPDIGLQLFDIASGRPETLCLPRASSVGAHWNGPFPYDNGPIKTFAPQHTHPHPRFSPDGKRVVYTSDYGGNAEVYEIEIDQATE